MTIHEVTKINLYLEEYLFINTTGIVLATGTGATNAAPMQLTNLQMDHVTGGHYGYNYCWRCQSSSVSTTSTSTEHHNSSSSSIGIWSGPGPGSRPGFSRNYRSSCSYTGCQNSIYQKNQRASLLILG